jgi:hypothetical protein
MATFSPTPVPEPASPPAGPAPQPAPDPTIPSARPAGEPRSSLAARFAALVLTETPYAAAYLEAIWDGSLLQLLEHGFAVLVSHGIVPGGPFPLVCAACGELWPCPLVTAAADWILVARRHGLLEEFGMPLDERIVAILERWHRDGLAVAKARAA